MFYVLFQQLKSPATLYFISTIDVPMPKHNDIILKPCLYDSQPEDHHKVLPLLNSGLNPILWSSGMIPWQLQIWNSKGSSWISAEVLLNQVIMAYNTICRTTYSQSFQVYWLWFFDRILNACINVHDPIFLKAKNW